ncbi:hypothetical protein CK203_072006 [Vitis vinifera]|uniref:Uncharacterized protein n=1 Tax=Vitis vinifera TaxID=29760 RepID=A0A438F441_VITVI|nr:hypothetical protein CK203_072006 [Vitis vinifera]
MVTEERVIEGWCLVGFWCLIVSISVVRLAAVESLSWWVFVGVWFSMFVLEMSWRRSRICGGFCTIGTLSISMETLLVVPQHRNQYYGRSKAHGSDRFVSSPSSDFREINCRTLNLGQKTPSPHSEDSKQAKTTGKSSAIAIPFAEASNYEKSFHDDFSYCELWAGPAYSNSPPPSSLPIPKFSMRPKRTVSLDLPGSAPVMKMHAIAKSAPPSPTREPYPSPRDLLTLQLRISGEFSISISRMIEVRGAPCSLFFFLGTLHEGGLVPLHHLFQVFAPGPPIPVVRHKAYLPGEFIDHIELFIRKRIEGLPGGCFSSYDVFVVDIDCLLKSSLEVETEIVVNPFMFILPVSLSDVFKVPRQGSRPLSFEVCWTLKIQKCWVVLKQLKLPSGLLMDASTRSLCPITHLSEHLQLLITPFSLQRRISIVVLLKVPSPPPSPFSLLSDGEVR